MNKKKHDRKLYVIRKVVFAKGIRDALDRESEAQIVAVDLVAGKNDVLDPAIGFSIQKSIIEDYAQ